MSSFFGEDAIRVFYETWQRYNHTFWPLVIVTYICAIAAIVLSIRKTRYTNPFISAYLAFLWFWSGLVFHLLYLAPTPGGARSYVSGTLFVIQSILMLIYGVFRKELDFKMGMNMYSRVGLMAVVNALIIYPIIGARTGHPFPDGPIFGIAPCPMAMFTFGMFLQTQGRFPIKLIIIPLLWSLTGFFALTVFELYASGGQLIIGVMGTLLILYRNRRLMANAVGTERGN